MKKKYYLACVIINLQYLNVGIPNVICLAAMFPLNQLTQVDCGVYGHQTKYKLGKSASQEKTGQYGT